MSTAASPPEKELPPFLSKIVPGRYDALLCDQWGVIHDGEALFPGAASCLQRLKDHNIFVLMLSNSTKTSEQTRKRLVKKKLLPTSSSPAGPAGGGGGQEVDLFHRLVTSGDLVFLCDPGINKLYIQSVGPELVGDRVACRTWGGAVNERLIRYVP